MGAVGLQSSLICPSSEPSNPSRCAYLSKDVETDHTQEAIAVSCSVAWTALARARLEARNCNCRGQGASILSEAYQYRVPLQFSSCI